MKDIVFTESGMGYIAGEKAAVTVGNSVDFYQEPEEPIEAPNKKLKRGIIPWGLNNTLPADLLAKVEKSTDLSSGLFFNVLTGYGDGIAPVRYVYDDDGKIEKVQIVRDNAEINAFFEINDTKRYLMEQLIDLNYFYNTFPEIVLNKERSKVVELYHREAYFSRWEEMNEKGVIERMAYSADWEKIPEEDDIIVTSVLDNRRPMLDLLEKVGRKMGPDGKDRTEKNVYRYIVPVSIPTPGRKYYQKPYWYSIIESGWYDFAVAIPEFKKYMLQNQMSLKYHIQLHKDYFKEIFKEERITTEEKKTKRIKQEYDNIKNMLKGMKNAGNTVISKMFKDANGNDVEMLKITTLDTNAKGGEYIGDIEEVSNIIFNSLHVHPSVIGAVPGKNKGSFSGTDKRELFIIKQALLKPVRDLLLRPFYLIKKVNKWPEDIHFAIPNIQLTTLDTNKKGNETVVQTSTGENNDSE